AFAWQFYDGLGRVMQTQKDYARTNVLAHAQDVNDVRTGIITNDHGSTAFTGATAGSSLIKASDFTQLQTGIQGLWSTPPSPNAPIGTVPNWSSNLTPAGPSPGPATPIRGSD